MDAMKISHTLSAGEILEVDFNCEIMYYKPHFILPDINLLVDQQESVIQNKVKYKIINAAYSFFCGQEYLDALNKIENLLLNDTESLIFVEGVSGSGKSTILRNIQNNNKLYEKYNVIHIDGDEKMDIKGLTKNIGRETIYSFYTNMITVFLEDVSSKWIRSQNNIAYLMKKFLDLIISTHKNDECEKYFKKFCKKVNEFNGLSNTDKIKWQTHYNNRIAIAIDREHMLYETRNQAPNPYYTTSLNMASQLDDADIKQQIAIDEFNRHLHYIQDLSVEHIQALSDFYINEDYRKDLKSI